MAIGTYGITRPSDVSPEDVEIIMQYTPTRDVTTDFILKRLDATTLLRPYFHNVQTGGNSGTEILGGLYNLTLPATDFNALGFYTLYIRPAEIRTSITDCGVLSSAANVKGLIINLANVPTQFLNKFVPQGLVGYRVEYLNNNGTKIPNFFRMITSCFFCEPVVTNQINTTQKSIRYRYVESNTNLLFLTLSPTSSPTNKPNATPFIGQPGQNIIITNTFFNPITIDIQMTEYDVESLAISLYGNQSKSIDDGIYTIYDSNNNIFKQYNLYEIRNQFNSLLYEVREDRKNNIDFSKSFNNITQ